MKVTVLPYCWATLLVTNLYFIMLSAEASRVLNRRSISAWPAVATSWCWHSTSMPISIMRMMEIGMDVECQHHEVATAGQAEIDLRFNTLLASADNMMKYKFVTKSVAQQYGKTVTFMPKPLFGDNGSRLRSPREPGLPQLQSLPRRAHPHVSGKPKAQAARVPPAGSLLQRLSHFCRHAHGRPRRHREQDRSRQAARQGHLRTRSGRGQQGAHHARFARRSAQGSRGRSQVSDQGRRVHRVTHRSVDHI